jgi:hypothetical protein
MSSGLRRYRCVLAVCLVLMVCACSRSQQVSQPELKAQIDKELRAVRAAEHDHLSSTGVGYLWSRLAVDYDDLADLPRAEDAYLRAIRLLKDAPEQRAQERYATMLDRLGSLYMAYHRVDDGAEYLKKSMAVRATMGDRTALGVSEMHLAEVELARNRFREAEKSAVEAQTNLTAAGDVGKDGLLATLLTLTFARCSLNRCAEGLRDAEHAMELARMVYPNNSLPFGHVQMALGFAQWKTGNSEAAEKAMLEGIRIIREQNAPGSPYPRNAMMQYRKFLQAMRRNDDVKRLDKGLAETMPAPCASCTVNVNGLSNAVR